MPRLPLKDSVTLKIGGGRDENDDPIPVQNIPIRASVTPISGDQQAQRGRSTTLTTYRLTVTDPRIEQVTTVIWRAQTYTLEGRAMPYRIGSGNTPHHYEVMMSLGSG
ncbi:hypothetical protein RND64_12335 [Gordonia sp. w5E2]|uniref:Head-tail adaptor protein n=1 Tax=Gordonia jacobaea TaxID=122202 RepID=A0ABR5I8E2_9ACTN|nr:MULTISPECIES: hypothetical protein [Gordonia]KNA89681.1 hypothetical protein ABW18_19985 [Gordonia jacobaea]DAL64974.1 MAG TPA_asm: Minor capsid protein [Caudoviricetes sp.]HQV19578.1 hypothetical protein [Gordonia sp. (in: high G+C Gram-positive bacteria)]